MIPQQTMKSRAGKRHTVEATRVEIELEKVASELETACSTLASRQGQLALWLKVPDGRRIVVAADLDALPASTDLDTALALSPGDGEAYRLRAQANLENGQLLDATRDIKQARKMSPRDVSAVVLRGRIVEARKIKGLPDDPSL